MATVGGGFNPGPAERVGQGWAEGWGVRARGGFGKESSAPGKFQLRSLLAKTSFPLFSSQV